MSVRRLSPEVVNRIAAGEVLDRPANLVKELVENSLDAGARSIEIDFSEGGRNVSVRDDGGGMSAEDLALAVERHATSKIQQSDDLFALQSFGFRGEALASIAAVSHLSVTSRVRGQDSGHRLECEFGSSGEVVTVSAREGTEVRSRDLFANVPARLKFLKSEAAEHGQIKSTLKALALAHEGVEFRILSRGQLLYHWPVRASFAERARSVLENDNLYAGRAEVAGLEAGVLVSSPQEAGNANRNMWFFAQGRWIQDRSLTAAVMEAYRNLLMHGEYPTVVVRLKADPAEIDVNVHPTKSQVKFRDSQSAFRVTSRAVREVLERAPWLEGVAPATTPPPVRSFEKFGETQSSLKFVGREFERTQYATKAFPLQQVREVLVEYGVRKPVAPAAGTAGPAETPVAFRWADLQVIGQLNQTYIVSQSSDAFYLIDQHAAHERVVFERLMEGFHDGKMEVQNLLLPLTLDFSLEEVEALVQHAPAVEKFGLTLERSGPETIAVLTIPTVVSECAVSAALKRLAIELSEFTGELAVPRAAAEIFASMACHSVVRAGQTMSAEEMKSLFVQMDQYPLSSFCPHGRPVSIKRRFAELEREFGRTV